MTSCMTSASHSRSADQGWLASVMSCFRAERDREDTAHKIEDLSDRDLRDLGLSRGYLS